jgi:16S rRNA (guanine(966)-N(2))-methyltransferase RsmD
LFNILAPRIQGSRFLDICAGSGAVGIEALSRGARQVTFIERSRHACAVIEANLALLGIAQPTILKNDAVVSLEELDQETTQYDIAFFDPPYASEIYTQVMNQLGSGDMLAPDALVVVEHRVKTPPGPECGKLRLFREVKQGESALAFYERVPD